MRGPTYLSPEVARKVREAARRHGMTVSAWLRSLVVCELIQFDPDEPLNERGAVRIRPDVVETDGVQLVVYELAPLTELDPALDRTATRNAAAIEGKCPSCGATARPYEQTPAPPSVVPSTARVGPPVLVHPVTVRRRASFRVIEHAEGCAGY